MQTTMDLLNRALTEREISQAEWCKQLEVNRTALAVARLRGRLSPTIAGNIARLMGEPVEHWIAVAALEAEPDSKGKQTLLRKEHTWARNLAQAVKSLFCSNEQRPKNRAPLGVLGMRRVRI